MATVSCIFFFRVAKKKVLLVDDSPIVRAVVVHALSAAGLDVVTIEEPRLLDETVAREKPDLLLVDATYPNVTDDDLVAILLGLKKQAFVLFSDRQPAEVAALVDKTGARGFVPKDGSTLAERLREYF
jgi:DNA-binding NarL/FixJ family response regulator